ncbi:hypothetical protein BH11MYX3_BH11MYX3_23150 [soil metagenome]
MATANKKAGAKAKAKKPVAKKPAPRKAAVKAKAKPAPKKKPAKAAPKKAVAKAAPKQLPPKVVAKPAPAKPKAAARAPGKLRMPRGTLPPAPPLPAPVGGARVVEILEDEQPIHALRRFLSTIDGEANVHQGQIALGSAQLMLLPIAREHRGGPEVKELLDLVLSRWVDFPDQTGFHSQEFLRNAFAAVGDDPERIARLVALVPEDASAELRFNMACAYAVVGTKAAMLQSLKIALEAGATPAQVRRDDDFAAYLDDPDFIELLDGASAPTIPVDIRPHVGSVRSALDSLISTLREYGEQGQLNPPNTLENVLAAERAKKIQLPNDYRALLTISDGMKLWDNEFLGTRDYRGETDLAKNAREYLAMSAGYGATGIDECIPLANWGQPNDWLLYDPRGTIRRGEPGYVLMLNADELPLDDLVSALERLERIASDILGTN